MADERTVYTPPKDPQAEPVCLLDRAWHDRRAVPPEALFDEARSHEVREDGATLRFEARPGMWERVGTFVSEERECCPFLAFQQEEREGEIVLEIMGPVTKVTAPGRGEACGPDCC
jgi:hypothetical protein